MKKIALVGATLALAMAAGSASAAGGPGAGTFGLNVAVGTATTPTDFMVGGRYFITKDMAVLAGMGLQFADNGAATDNKSTNLGMMGGFRKYLRTDDLAPFVGGQIQYVSTKPNGGDQTDFALVVEVGAEYFLSRQFSLEGSVFAGYMSSESKAAGSSTTNKATVFGTARGNLSVNFYF